MVDWDKFKAGWRREEMTNEQKDAIVAAAQELVKNENWHSMTGRFEALSAAVRAAEQRWTVGDGGGTVWNNSVEFCDSAGRGFTAAFCVWKQDAERIARLLNEDDARQKP
jgi:hypothetical protein